MQLSTLWRAPRVNPVTGKAYSVPVLNPADKYGRTFFFSTFGFMIAFMSWYAFPPLLSKTIKADLQLTQDEIANSNIVALVATLIVRLCVGPLCDRFGPRIVFASILIAGSIPTALAGTVQSAEGLIAIRFFVGILGGTFVPCQVWSTGFFDKEVVGTANALMAGLGNAGGGITYFVMPAIFDSLVQDRGLTPHSAWRVAFIVPFILINALALGMLFLCEDTPTGRWADRHNAVHAKTDALEKTISHAAAVPPPSPSSEQKKDYDGLDEKKKAYDDEPTVDIEAAQIGELTEIEAINAEIIVAPTWKEMLHVLISPQTLVLAAGYACSFGGELAINSILGSYYIKNFHLNQTESGRWASMFGLVNVFFRPLGGIVSDLLYNRATWNKNVNVKKYWLSGLGICMGAVALAIGLVDSHDMATMFCLVVLLALFMDASNGASFSLVPHVHPFANGIVSGIVGAGGNLGGVIFALLFRFHGKDYGQVIWIFGAVSIGINIVIGLTRTIPKGQIGGR